jgi:Copper amine oxidase N-terminal domain
MLLKKSIRSVISIFLAAMLVVLAGCQSIAGVDISKMAAKNFTVNSSEGNLSMSMQFLTDESFKPNSEDAAIISLINSMKLTVDSIKAQDSTHVSMAGKLTIKDKDIPFKSLLTDKSMTIHIDGAKKPIVIPMNYAGEGLTPEMMAQFNGLDKEAEKLIPTLVQYFVKNTPDMKVETSKVTEKINGQSVPMTKLHIELNGSDLIKLFKGLLDNIAKDEAGLKELIGQLYDVMMPIMKESMKADPDAAGIIAFLDNKETTIAMIMPMIVETLKDLSAEFDVNDPSLKELNALSLKLDLYVDSESYIRKSAMDLNVVLPGGAKSDGIKGFKVNAISDAWNINKPVKVDTIDVSGGTFKMDPTEDVSFGKFMSNFDKNSAFYKLIKDDMKLLSKNALFNVVTEDQFVAGNAYTNKDQYTMVPTRALLEQLDAEVKWDAVKKEITIIDYFTETTIVMHVDSNKATVNGVEKEMHSAVVSKEGSSYVPLRFVTTEFGFDISHEAGVVTVTRK